MGFCLGLEKFIWSMVQEMIYLFLYRFRCGLDRNLVIIMKKCVVQYIYFSEKVCIYIFYLKSNCK